VDRKPQAVPRENEWDVVRKNASETICKLETARVCPSESVLHNSALPRLETRVEIDTLSAASRASLMGRKMIETPNPVNPLRLIASPLRQRSKPIAHGISDYIPSLASYPISSGDELGRHKYTPAQLAENRPEIREHLHTTLTPPKRSSRTWIDAPSLSSRPSSPLSRNAQCVVSPCERRLPSVRDRNSARGQNLESTRPRLSVRSDISSKPNHDFGGMHDLPNCKPSVE